MKAIRGCGTALVTPFLADGAVDVKRLRALVEWQIAEGIDFLVPCGTTGETPTLSHDEWRLVIETTIEAAAGRVPIVAGATSNHTAEAVKKAVECAKIPGVDALLSASPYYNKPTQEGQYLHFKVIAEAVDKRIVVYNVPGRTGVNLLPETLVRLAELPNIYAVKEASGIIGQIAEICAKLPNFTVLSGDDALVLPVVAVGGVGVISVTSNTYPREMAEMTRLAMADQWTAARKLYHHYLALAQAHFIESNPLPVKAVLAMMGKIEENYRLPLCPMQPALRAKLEQVARAAGVVK
jgi:4-hydroxy-tetrahydrodipicolinate synthase